MTEELYQRMLTGIRDSKYGAEAITLLMKICTHATVVGFAALLFVLYNNGSYEQVYRSVLVCGVSFVVVSVFRKLLGAKRPYEVFDIQPLVEKESTGNSFPSRHVFSCAIIAMAFLAVNVPLGILFLILAAILAACRVLSGLHFIHDVLAGYVIGVICGLVGFFVIF